MFFVLHVDNEDVKRHLLSGRTYYQCLSRVMLAINS